MVQNLKDLSARCWQSLPSSNCFFQLGQISTPKIPGSHAMLLGVAWRASKPSKVFICISNRAYKQLKTSENSQKAILGLDILLDGLEPRNFLWYSYTLTTVAWSQSEIPKIRTLPIPKKAVTSPWGIYKFTERSTAQNLAQNGNVLFLSRFRYLTNCS